MSDDTTPAAGDAPVTEEEVLVDLDPSEVIDVYGDPDTDTEEDPVLDEGHPYEPEDVPGAEPPADEFAEVVIPSAEDELTDDVEEV